MDSLVSLTLDAVARNLKLYLTPDGVTALPNNLKNRILKKLLSSTVFRRNVNFEDALSATINKDTELINLTDITLNNNILKLLQKATYLKKLYLTNSCDHDIATNDLINVFEDKKYLTLLVLERCSHVTDEIIICISKKCNKLQNLSLTGCKNVTDVGVVSLRDLELNALSLAHTQITNDGVLHLILGKIGKTLKELDLNQTNQSKLTVTPDFVQGVREYCPNLVSLNFNSSMCNLSSVFSAMGEKPKNMQYFACTFSW